MDYKKNNINIKIVFRDYNRKFKKKKDYWYYWSLNDRCQYKNQKTICSFLKSRESIIFQGVKINIVK